MKLRHVFAFLLVAVISAPAQAQLFQIGQDGFAQPGNNWPPGENASFAIDGAGQKYLNFGKENTGVAVTPTAAAAPGAITVWSANDEIPRDPASYAIYGTNHPAQGNPGDLIGDLVWLTSGDLALPDSRNDGGAAPLDPANAYTASFDALDIYETYVVVFPTLKDSANANSMQIAEVQLSEVTGAPIFTPNDMIVGGQLIPEPSTVILAGLGATLLLLRRRR